MIAVDYRYVNIISLNSYDNLYFKYFLENNLISKVNVFNILYIAFLMLSFKDIYIENILKVSLNIWKYMILVLLKLHDSSVIITIWGFCFQNGNVRCSRVTCRETCDHPANTTDCCPVCRDCFYEGKVQRNGVTFKSDVDPCRSCSCRVS